MRVTMITITGLLTLTAGSLLALGVLGCGTTAGAETWASQTVPPQTVINPTPPAKEDSRSESIRVLLVPEQENDFVECGGSTHEGASCVFRECFWGWANVD